MTLWLYKDLGSYDHTIYLVRAATRVRASEIANEACNYVDPAWWTKVDAAGDEDMLIGYTRSWDPRSD